MPLLPKRAPTKPIGVPEPMIGGLGTPFPELPGWTFFADNRELVPELTWPRSVETYERMEPDTQLRGLALAGTLPIRRFRWEIDPQGARPQVAAHIADGLRLPVRGSEPPPKRSGAFSHDTHLAHALRAPYVYGHYFFEEDYEYRDPEEGGDGLVHLKALWTRPPRTISNFTLDRNGQLTAVVQNLGIGVSGGVTGVNTPIEANRIIAYVWEPQDDADVLGRPFLRACYKNWLIKDRLLRVDAVKHERNAMGIPWFEVDPNASKAQMESLSVLAESIRAGERGGGAGAAKLHVKGVEGTLPDTIASIRYQDQQMSRAFLALFFDLGTTETGSRALGSELIDWYTDTQTAIADWYCEVQQERIEREVFYNWGENEQPPAISYTRVESAALAFEDLVKGVESGLIAVDPELRAYIEQRWKVPGQAKAGEAQEAAEENEEAPPALPQNASDGKSEDARKGHVEVEEHTRSVPSATQPKRSALATAMQETVTGPMSWPDLARAVGRSPKDGTARRARDQLLKEGAMLRVPNKDGTLLPANALALPDRELRRNPYPFEVAASVDFAQMERVYTTQRTSLVAAVKAAQGAQIDQLGRAVEAAAGDAEKLAQLTVDPVDPALIESHLLDAARAGEASAKQERDAQLKGAATASSGPASAAEADKSLIDERVSDEAKAVALTLAGGLAAAASKRASALRSLPAGEAAAKVREYLSGLSDAELELQLGGAVQHSYGTGRQEFMKANSPKEVFASELLDGNTCEECTGIDGAEYPSVAASEGDYPSGGGYVGCEGGLRCRGTIIASY